MALSLPLATNQGRNTNALNMRSPLQMGEKLGFFEGRGEKVEMFDRRF